MTHKLIETATLEQLVGALEARQPGALTGSSSEWASWHQSQKAAITALSAALAGAEPTGWIAAKDRMPPPQVRVLGFEPQYNIVDVDMWFGPDFNWGYSYWMPLPPAPKEQL